MSMECSLTATETTLENGELNKRNLYYAHNGNLLWVSLRALLKFKKGGIIKGKKKKKGVEIIPTKGYYSVFVNGSFYCTADTYAEAKRELENNGII